MLLSLEKQERFSFANCSFSLHLQANFGFLSSFSCWVKNTKDKNIFNRFFWSSFGECWLGIILYLNALLLKDCIFQGVGANGLF